MVTRHTNYNSTKSKEERLAEDHFINPLPRAVVRHNTQLLLDGEWKFAIDRKSEGLQHEWYLRHDYTAVAEWPGSIEDHIASAKDEVERTAWKDKVVAWYER